jgi:hypothetical protein
LTNSSGLSCLLMTMIIFLIAFRAMFFDIKGQNVLDHRCPVSHPLFRKLIEFFHKFMRKANRKLHFWRHNFIFDPVGEKIKINNLTIKTHWVDLSLIKVK